MNQSVRGTSHLRPTKNHRPKGGVGVLSVRISRHLSGRCQKLFATSITFDTDIKHRYQIQIRNQQNRSYQHIIILTKIKKNLKFLKVKQRLVWSF